MVDDIITHNDSYRHKFAITQNVQKPIRLLYYNGMPELMRKRSMLTLKELKQNKVNEISLLESLLKYCQTSAIIQEIFIL